MNQEEKNKFRKQYESFDDSQLIQMAADGKEAYVEGAYELLREELQRRGIEVKDSVEAQVKEVNPEISLASEPQPELNAYVQLVIINLESDRAFIESLLISSGIPYFMQSLNIREHIALPAGLMVEQSKVEEAIELLKDFKPGGSITLW